MQKWTAQGYEVWVSIHWGDDYSYCVNRDQVDIATNITAWGACLIMGHHAHVVQPMHLQGNNVCFFGLGGYVFGHFWKKGQWSSLFRKTKKGLVIKLDFQNDGTKKFLYFQSQENWNHQVVIRQWNFVEWSRKLWVFSKIKHSNAIIRRLFTIFETQTCKFHHQMSSFGTNGWSKFLRRIDKSV
ncbi:MAG: CapA family protein [Bacteroidetes bacterium]|nr:CapA family protein [Bacteroidota bacterium]